MGALTPHLTDTLSYPPMLPIQETAAWDSESITFKGGTSQGFWRANKKLRKFKLAFTALTQLELAELTDFLDARKDAATKFYIDHPMTGETDIPVRYVSFSYSFIAPGNRSAQLELKEVS